MWRGGFPIEKQKGIVTAESLISPDFLPAVAVLLAHTETGPDQQLQQ